MQTADSDCKRGRSWTLGIATALLVIGALIVFILLPTRKRGAPDRAAQSRSRILTTGTGTAGDAGTISWHANSLGTNVNKRWPHGRTALIWAAMFNDAEEARKLIEKGAGVNLADNSGRTPLYYATGFGDEATNLAKLLIEHGADVNASDEYGASILDMALGTVGPPHSKLVELLENAGATSRWERVKE